MFDPARIWLQEQRRSGGVRFFQTLLGDSDGSVAPKGVNRSEYEQKWNSVNQRGVKLADEERGYQCGGH